MRIGAPRSRRARALLLLAPAGGVAALLYWRGPDWEAVGEAFQFVRWDLAAAAVGFNLASVLARSLAWSTVIDQALPPPRPAFVHVFSGFSVGLLANAVLPGRIGELARVAVLTRKLPGRRGVWAALVGTVFAHRLFDLVPVVGLIAYVLATARVPAWAVTSLAAVVGIGAALFTFAFVSAKRPHAAALDGLGSVRRLVAMARQGLGVMHAPAPAGLAVLFQGLAWLCQFFAVYTAMRAFHIDEPLPAAGLVLLLMNVATVFPLWPGNVGLLQAAVALPLVQYGVDYGVGFAFGIGLQAIEASVGVGFGLAFLAREGLTFAVLRRMPDATQADTPAGEAAEEGARTARARVPG